MLMYVVYKQAGHCLWELTFHNGFGALCAPEQERLLLEDVFKMKVWHHDVHGTVTVGGNQATTLSSMMRKFEPLKLSFRFGTNQTCCDLPGCHLKWPRAPAAVILIGMKDVYEALGLSQFKGQSWRWISSGFSYWLTTMSCLGYSNHLVPSDFTQKASFDYR